MSNTFREFYNSCNFINFAEFLKKEYGMNILVSPVDSYLISEDEEHRSEVKFWINLDNDKACECSNIIAYAEAMKNVSDSLIANIDDCYETEMVVSTITKGFFRNKVTNQQVTYVRRRHEYQTYDTYVHDVLLNQYT
jgi:hypothetical protein